MTEDVEIKGMGKKGATQKHAKKIYSPSVVARQQAKKAKLQGYYDADKKRSKAIKARLDNEKETEATRIAEEETLAQ